VQPIPEVLETVRLIGHHRIVPVKPPLKVREVSGSVNRKRNIVPVYVNIYRKNLRVRRYRSR
jgi:hypothetical protein